VANPNPLECQTFFVDVSYFNFILSDQELMSHMDRNRRVRSLAPLNVTNALFHLPRVRRPNPEVWSEIEAFWEEIGRNVVVAPPTKVVLNSSTFLFYPCLPRLDNVSLLPYRVQPVFDEEIRVNSCPPFVSEYSIAFHVFYNNSLDGVWRCLFRFDCSWALWTDGSSLRLMWNDSKVSTRDLMVEIGGGVMKRAEWVHVAARVWEESIDLYVDGKMAQRVLGSPKVPPTFFLCLFAVELSLD
jgi:hypothetical protein